MAVNPFYLHTKLKTVRLEMTSRRNDFNSDDRTSYDAFAVLPESFANIELMQPVRRSSIRFLIDSERLGDTPTSKNAFCVYKCTACQVVNIELKVNLNLEK